MADAHVLDLTDYLSRRESAAVGTTAENRRLLRRLIEFDRVIDHWRRQERAARARINEFEDAKRRFVDSLAEASL